MGRHVKTVGQQRHRPEHGSGDDLSEHHHSRQADDDPGPPLVAGMIRTKENMIVLPGLDGIGVHLKPSL